MSESYRIKYYDNKKQKLISGTLTILISGALLLFILTYKTVFITVTPPVYIDINFDIDDLGANFGTDEVGLGEEEPADQEVLRGEGNNARAENSENNISTNDLMQEENKTILAHQNDSKENIPEPVKKTETKKNSKTKNSSKNTNNLPIKKSKTNTVAGVGTENSTVGGNPKGNAALGNLIKGKGTSTSSTGEGTGGRPGQNQGVETGGNGNGGEGIGNGRKLISFIPGTMGRGGKVPEHNCAGSGTIIFSYTLDKNGNVISVSRKSGINNTCLLNTGIKWIKQYVKGNSGTRSVTGTYKINF
ncbi:ferric siderophore ABC transporter substrate-binding protein [Apibacter sp.]|uniref:ferric siderophore ABC transporter substrate-binding protein n=1 Tax=Apibacter sp. TaxID=2023709 RepID=UPI0025E9F849|nr:ferric siderophore ABC transporter substrate-binding protein [Apibacter sp.]MCT6868598.1 ferric siderophore ABC transporter substrate-binding protein [Apibacter sp.]